MLVRPRCFTKRLRVHGARNRFLSLIIASDGTEWGASNCENLAGHSNSVVRKMEAGLTVCHMISVSFEHDGITFSALGYDFLEASAALYAACFFYEICIWRLRRPVQRSDVVFREEFSLRVTVSPPCHDMQCYVLLNEA